MEAKQTWELGGCTSGSYLHTSLPLENMEARMTSGAIQAYVPAALILVVRCHSRASPKSVIFRILLLRSPFSTFCRINTDRESNMGENKQISVNHRVFAIHLPPPAGSAVLPSCTEDRNTTSQLPTKRSLHTVHFCWCHLKSPQYLSLQGRHSQLNIPYPKIFRGTSKSKRTPHYETLPIPHI